MNHPMHPALVHFPIACWTLVTAGDLLGFFYTINNDQLITSVGILLCIGLVFALGAMLAGLMEVDKLAKNPQAKRTALWHVGMVCLSFCFYSASLFFRVQAQQFIAADFWAIACSLGGLMSLLVGGWLGGQLVYHHGVGQVDR